MGFAAKPRFVTFDMNGTLIKFAINDAKREVLRTRLPPDRRAVDGARLEYRERTRAVCAGNGRDAPERRRKRLPPARGSRLGTQARVENFDPCPLEYYVLTADLAIGS